MAEAAAGTASVGVAAVSVPTTASLRAHRAALLRWFAASARDLPWRRSRDPYAIWISEVMLQQTRVETVIPYFERFIARFPDASALAAADEDALLSHWSGLGYYRRARQLHAAAKVIARDHAGHVPRDPEARRALPGVGAYTAGAIGSIAFDLPEPIVDGNVARVLSRFHGLAAPIGSRESERALWASARVWAEGERPGALNQALMELGATVCAPVSPRCDACPIARACAARRDDRVDQLPVPRARKAPKVVHLVAVRATAKAGTYLCKSEGALFGGLYGLPFAEVPEGASPRVRRSAAERALRDAGLAPISALRSAGALTHVLTHRRLEVERLDARVRAGQGARARAFDDSALSTVGISTLARRLLALEQ